MPNIMQHKLDAKTSSAIFLVDQKLAGVQSALDTNLHQKKKSLFHYAEEQRRIEKASPRGSQQRQFRLGRNKSSIQMVSTVHANQIGIGSTNDLNITQISPQSDKSSEKVLRVDNSAPKNFELTGAKTKKTIKNVISQPSYTITPSAVVLD